MDQLNERAELRALPPTVGRYQPCFEIESGGMATVYLAQACTGSGPQRFVALKRIHPHLVGEPGFVEMFLDEARILSRIVHPNVCSVYDYGVSGDSHYIVMEYLVGEPLSRVARALSITTHRDSINRCNSLVAKIIADACEGLHAAHELVDATGEKLNVVHRDVSPQNLFLTYDGAVKVVDFGLALCTGAIHKTRTGMLKGKFAYLAPEALAMRPLDRRADVWGLGVVLWELLTLERLFLRSNEMETLVALSTCEVPPPSKIRPGIPPALDSIVLRALARDPNERYPTTRELGRDLLKFVHQGDQPVGMPDLSEWMDSLFPGGRVRKQELLEIGGQLAGGFPSGQPSLREDVARAAGSAGVRAGSTAPPHWGDEGRIEPHFDRLSTFAKSRLDSLRSEPTRIEHAIVSPATPTASKPSVEDNTPRAHAASTPTVKSAARALGNVRLSGARSAAVLTCAMGLGAAGTYSVDWFLGRKTPTTEVAIGSVATSHLSVKESAGSNMPTRDGDNATPGGRHAGAYVLEIESPPQKNAPPILRIRPLDGGELDDGREECVGH